MTLVCFDTQVMIWGIKSEANPGQEEMINKAKYLIARCDKEKQRVLIPSVVVAELLSGTKPEQLMQFYQVIQRRFIIQPFDVKAALHYAKIWQAKRQISQQLRDREEATRSEIKADCMIIAIAVANQASCIYTHDGSLRKLAKDFIDTRDLPEIPAQNMSLFDLLPDEKNEM